MKLIKHISVEDALDNGIRPKKQRQAPRGVSQHIWNKGHGVGMEDLAWMRGHHSGLFDAYLTLKQKYPDVAEEFRKAVGFNQDGAF